MAVDDMVEAMMVGTPHRSLASPVSSPSTRLDGAISVSHLSLTF